MTRAEQKLGKTRVSEHSEQANFIAEVHLRYASRDDFVPTLLFATANGAWLGGNNKYALMKKYRREGWKNGIFDLLYLQPRGGYNCLAIEMKAVDRQREKDGGVSREQADFLAALDAAGGLPFVCYGAQDAIEKFDYYMAQEVT